MVRLATRPSRSPQGSRRLVRRLSTLVLAALLAGTVAACGNATAPQADSNPAPAADDTTSADAEPSGTADDAAEVGESMTSTALVVSYGKGQPLFVDQQTEAPYFPTLPEGQVFAQDGSPLDASGLANGNVVRVTGNGIMLQSYPAQYPGIQKVEVIDEGDPADAEPYDELVAGLWVEPDPAEPPLASLSYRTADAVVSTAPLTCSSTWSFEQDGETLTSTTDTPHPVQYEAEGMPSVDCGAPVEVRLFFEGHGATAVAATRWSEEDISAAAEAAGSVHSIDPAALAGEEATATIADGAVTLTVEPGWRYALDVTFDAGTVTYVFTAA